MPAIAATSIAILLPDLRGGGAERVNIDLATEFVRAGHEVEFVLMRARGELLSEAQENFAIVDLATPRARDVPVALSRYLRRRQPDALLAAMWPLSVIAPLAQRLSRHRCNVVVSEHGVLSAQYRSWGGIHNAAMRFSMALGYRLADARVGVSGGVANDMSTLSKLNLRAFSVIHNPVPPRPEPDEATLQEADALWSGARGRRVVTVGTMKPVKNHPLLLQAFAILDRQDARLLFVGDGSGRSELEGLAKQLGVADRVIFVGFQTDPTPFYATADLFVLSSNYEGFGNVIVEALSSVLPVVSTDCPSGPAEILENGRWGRLVPVGDASSLASAMDAALSAPTDPDALKRRAADFAPEIAARQYLDLLEAP